MFRPPPASPLFPYTTLFRSPIFCLVILGSVPNASVSSTDAAGARCPVGRWVANCDLAPGASESLSLATPSHPALFLRSEEHTSELQSHHHLVCRLLLEKKNG